MSPGRSGNRPTQSVDRSAPGGRARRGRGAAGELRNRPTDAIAASTQPNILVIETDDQTRASMRVMDNVNSLIGDQGATFNNSFVNFSLCCPSRATFLTGQYAHNHGISSNDPPTAATRPSRTSTRATTAVWLQSAGYYTAMVGKYLNQLRERPAGAAGLVGVARGRRRRPGRLQLHDQRQRHAGRLRERPRRLQAGRADARGGRLRRPPRPTGSRSSCGSPTRRRT